MSSLDMLEYIGNHLLISCTIEDKIIKVCMKNNGQKILEKGAWCLYLYSMHHLTVSVRHTSLFQLTHVNGSLFKLQPLNGFFDMVPESSLELILISEHPIRNRSEMFPNWYVADHTNASILKSTSTLDYVKYNRPFINPEHIHTTERKDTITGTNFYEDKITPTPSFTDVSVNSTISVTAHDWALYGDLSQSQYASELLQMIFREKEEPPEQNFILFKHSDKLSKEGYEILVSENEPQITVQYGSEVAEFYALITLSRMLEIDSGSIPCGVLKDEPQFEYRGLHIDVSRNFHAVPTILKVIKMMSLYKLNKLQLHLTDDEGWRIEIKGIPELTQIGGTRCHFGAGIEPQLGSGPFANTSGSGFYTFEDYKKILTCANQHHVTVIPEIDLPGHCYSAIKALKARYNKFTDSKDMDQATKYLPVEIDDPQSAESVQMYNQNTLNPCVEGTYRFINQVIESMKELHEDIQPLKMIHIGGDEVPDGSWNKSKLCQSYFPESKHLNEEVFKHFIKRTKSVCDSHGIKIAVWADCLAHDESYAENISPDLAVSWRISQKNEKYNPYSLANNGHKVVLASASHLYLDIQHEDDFDERGLHWAAPSTNTKKVFGVKPMDIYSCFEKDNMVHEQIKKPENVIGLQVELWCETVRTESNLEYMLFPRLIAFAERVWNIKSESWDKFAKKLVNYELPQLEKLKIQYRLPTPIIRYVKNELIPESPIPGLKFFYRQDIFSDWIEVEQGSTFTPGASYTFITKSTDNSRTSLPATCICP